MSSVHAVSFNRQYGSFRTTNAGIPKSPVIGGLNRGLIATISTTAQPSRVTTRSMVAGQQQQQQQVTAASMKNQENQGSRVIAVTPRSCRKALTSNGTGGTANGGNGTKKIGLNSPLQSPQIIRSTRIEQNNWNKKLTSNFCSLHSKSPGSSGTSVESIVPKYSNTSVSSNGALKASFSTFNPRNGAVGSAGEPGLTSNGSQKRAYNVNKPIAKGSTAKCINSSNSSSVSSRVNNGCVTHKIVSKKLYKESNAPAGYVAQMASALSNGLTASKTSSSTSSTSSSSYSSKFPNGLPFENEFYRRPRRSLSEGRRPSEHPDTRLSQSQRRSNSSDTVSLSAYGDEFSRKPSNEDLFVDFTKSLPETPKSTKSSPVKPCNPGTTTTSSIVEYRNINHSNYFYKFESISCAADSSRHLRRQRRPSPRDDSRNNNGAGGGGGAADYENDNAGDEDEDVGCGEELEGEKSTVYVAVATWVPKCNRLPYQQQDEAIGVLGPTSENADFDGSSRRRRERSKRSHHRRSPDSSRRRNRHREDKSSRRHHKDRERKEREDRTPVKNGSTTTAAVSAAEPTKKSVKVVEPASGKDKATATAPTRKQGTPVRKTTANHDTNHAKRSRSPEPNTSSSSSSSSSASESSTPTATSSSSSTPAVPAPAAPKPAPAPEPPTIKGSGPNGELTLKDIPVSGISFQEVYNPEHEGPPTTKVIIYKPKSGKGQPTAKVIVTKVP